VEASLPEKAPKPPNFIRLIARTSSSIGLLHLSNNTTSRCTLSSQCGDSPTQYIIESLRSLTMADTKPRQRKFAPRSKTGCLSCRTRRKRCDAGRPQCENCLRLNLTCVYQEKRNVHVENLSKSKSPPLELQVSHSSLNFWDLLPGGLDEASEQKHILQCKRTMCTNCV
jgi:hypothetical protein